MNPGVWLDFGAEACAICGACGACGACGPSPAVILAMVAIDTILVVW
jgi:hypothetical protein